MNGDHAFEIAAFGAVVSWMLAGYRHRRSVRGRARDAVDPIEPHAGYRTADWRAGLPPAAVAEIEAGRKIPAIKAYREATGAGLSEAKRIIDAAIELRGRRSP